MRVFVRFGDGMGWGGGGVLMEFEGIAHDVGGQARV